MRMNFWLCSFVRSDRKKKIYTRERQNFSHLRVLADEPGSRESDDVNERLENIDGETDNLDITFVKMADPRYARKWGVTKLPAIVYFRKRFPSIYRGKLAKKKKIN